MQSKEVGAFVAAAKTYCNFIDSHVSFEEKGKHEKMETTMSYIS